MGNFDAATRLQRLKQPSMSRPTGGGTTRFTLPKAGLLAGIRLNVTGAVSGTLSAQNALGFSSILNRVRVVVNNGQDLINISGAGYHYLLRQFINDYRDPVNAATGRTAITATTYDISMYLPIALNIRDATGLFPLQNEQTTVNLELDWLADASVATGATVTGTAVPQLDLFTIPARREDYPPLNLVQQIIEETVTVSGAGDVTYNFPRGSRYLQMLMGLGIGASGSDGWSAAKLRMQQANFFVDTTPTLLTQEYAESHLAARLAGTIPFDFIGSSGLGTFGKVRDAIDSSQLTDLAAIVTATGAGTLYALRRQLTVVEQMG